jgi:hypothetical protein
MNCQFDVALAGKHLEWILDELIAVGEHVGITRDGDLVAVLVPYAWYRDPLGSRDSPLDSGNR